MALHGSSEHKSPQSLPKKEHQNISQEIKHQEEQVKEQPRVNALATYRLRIQIARGLIVDIAPRMVGDTVFLNIDVVTPAGPMTALLSMKQDVFVKITTFLEQKKIVPKLSDLIEGSFGHRPLMSRR